jgi:hypothetical protein
MLGEKEEAILKEFDNLQNVFLDQFAPEYWSQWMYTIQQKFDQNVQRRTYNDRRLLNQMNPYAIPYPESYEMEKKAEEAFKAELEAEKDASKY